LFVFHENGDPSSKMTCIFLEIVLKHKVNAVEGDIAKALRLLDSEDSELKIGSYPFFNSDVDFGVNVVIKSVDEERLIKSVDKFKEFLNQNSINFDN
jgi:hypothetical protein